MRNQKPYVLRRLQEAGDQGLHSWQLRHEGIGNPSQRMNELRDRGYVIDDTSEPRDGCPGTRYVLLDGAEQDGVTTATEPPVGASPMSAVPLSVMEDARGREADPPSGPTLFDVAPVSGGYRDTERAA